MFFDLHSGDRIRKGQEYQRCLVHISKAKFSLDKLSHGKKFENFDFKD
jgi:hypothetical protein